MENIFIDLIQTFITKFISFFIEVLPFFFIASIIGALIQTYLNINIVRKFINKRFISPIITALFGAIAPVCSCSMIPLAQTINSFSRYYSPTLAFLITAPALSPVIFFLMLGMFDISLVLFRFFWGILIAIIGSYFVDYFFKKPRMLGLLNTSQSGVNLTKWEKFKKHFKEIFIDTGKYVLLGLLIASLITTLISPEFIKKFSDNDFTYMLIAIISIPLYLSAGEEVPIGKSLIEVGFTGGQALTFMFAGAGICIPTIMATLKFFPKNLVFYYVGLWLFGSILGGILYDLFLL